MPQEPYENLTNKEKVVVILLAQHALEALGMADEQWITPSQIAERSGIKKGSVYPVVRELDEGDIVESDDGSYQIPTHSLETAKHHLEPEEAEV